MRVLQRTLLARSPQGFRIMTTRVKICGVRRAEDIQAAAAHGADAVGLNFYRKSPRFVGDLAAAAKLIADSKCAEKIQWAGVFVNADAGLIVELARELPLQIVQLHGDETPEFTRDLKQKLPQ